MIIDNSYASNIEVIGNDITEFKTGIDPRNLELITTLLSSNLYSHPEESFIRETVSNAYDSHIEAGNYSDPIIIRFKYETGEISIRDYGVGISPERFKEIYCNIGSSTKRATNDYIGGFGIGRFSALACSNMVHLTSYYNGKEFYYIMTKDGNSIVTNLVRVVDTKEKNGVEVSIKNINLSTYGAALKSIAFFPNIFIDSDSICHLFQEINSSRIIRYNNYSAINMSMSDKKILLGNVLYPLDLSILDKDERKIIALIANSGIVINFDIGELSITPNRETIIYTEETKKVIKERILKLKEELVNNILEELQDLNINRFLRLCEGEATYNPVNGIFGSLSYDPRDLLFDANGMSLFTFEGKPVSMNAYELFRRVIRNPICNFYGFITADKIRKKPTSFPGSAEESFFNSKKLVINTNKINPILNAYLREYYKDYIILKGRVSPSMIPLYLKENLSYTFPTLTQETLKMASDLIPRIVNNNIITINPDTDYNYSIFKENRSYSTTKVSPVSLRIWASYNASFHIHKFKNIEAAIYYIKRLKRGVMITTRESVKDWYRYVCDYSGYALIICNKQFLSIIQSHNLTNILSEDKLLSKSWIRRLASVKNMRWYSPLLLNLFTDKDEAIYLTKLLSSASNYQSTEVYNSLFDSLDAVKIKSDPYTDYLLKKYKALKIKIDRFLGENNLDEYSLNNPYILAILLKYKVCRIPYSEYVELKNNKIIKMLCTKF